MEHQVSRWIGAQPEMPQNDNEGVPSWSIVSKVYKNGQLVYNWPGMIEAAQQDPYWELDGVVEIVRTYDPNSVSWVKAYHVQHFIRKNDLGTYSLYIHKKGI